MPDSDPENKPNKLTTIPVIVNVPEIAYSVKETKGDTSIDVTPEKDADNRYQGEETSYKKASLMEEVHHIRMQKSYSPNIPDLHSDQEISETDTDMNRIYTSMNKAEIHHQNGKSQVFGRTSNVTSIQVEVSDKVQRQTSTGV